jgi:hypothetical protein
MLDIAPPERFSANGSLAEFSKTVSLDAAATGAGGAPLLAIATVKETVAVEEVPAAFVAV